jgi:flagellin-like protein
MSKGVKGNMMKTRRSTRALSPIFATLILIAIAVIAGIVVYMFTSGTIASMTGGGTAGQEKVAVQSASYASGTVTVIVQSTGGPAATVNGLILKDATGNTVDSDNAPTAAGTNSLILQNGVLNTITGSLTAPSPGTYTVTVITKAGGSFVSSSFSVATV